MALDRLGFDEAWFGEHHSGGYELIACPEVFIAAAAERTKHIRLGTGVVSLPYHHPLMVADRWVLLDHLTRGRVMFGTGPGALPSDAYMMGIDPIEQRRMMQESLEAILALFRAEPSERVNRDADWFTLRDAQLHIRPYTWPYPEISTAAMISPSGPRLAGALGTSLLSLSMSVPGGYAALDNTWQVVEEQAAKAGRDAPDRAGWRVLSIMHIADTRDKAIDDCTYGLQDFANYFGAAGFVPLANAVEGAQTPHEFVEDYAAKGNCCIGSPDDAIAHIEDLLRTVRRIRDAADARPRLGFTRGDLPLLRPDGPQSHSALQGSTRSVPASHEWAKDKRDELIGRAGQAVVQAITEHVGEHQRKPPQLLRASVLRDGRMVYRDDLPDPEPGPGQVLVAVRSCGICGSDLHFASHGAEVLSLTGEISSQAGGMAVDLSRDVFMGHEFSAEILEPVRHRHASGGNLVTSIPVLLSGNNIEPIVYSNTTVGGYAERMLLSAPLLLPIPNGLDPQHASLAEPMAVGLHAVNKSGIQPGEPALVLGCGPIGIAVVAALRPAESRPLWQRTFHQAARTRRDDGRAQPSILRRVRRSTPRSRRWCSKRSVFPESSTM